MFDLTWWKKWRATIPFTDEAIAEALDQEAADLPEHWLVKRKVLADMAARTRAGRLSKAALCEALPRLVTRCGICGKKAIYRMGSVGRCSTHRMVATSGMVERWQGLEQKSTEIEKLRQAVDALDRTRPRAGSAMARTTLRRPRRTVR